MKSCIRIIVLILHCICQSTVFAQQESSVWQLFQEVPTTYNFETEITKPHSSLILTNYSRLPVDSQKVSNKESWAIGAYIGLGNLEGGRLGVCAEFISMRVGIGYGYGYTLIVAPFVLQDITIAKSAFLEFPRLLSESVGLGINYSTITRRMTKFYNIGLSANISFHIKKKSFVELSIGVFNCTKTFNDEGIENGLSKILPSLDCKVLLNLL